VPREITLNTLAAAGAAFNAARTSGWNGVRVREDFAARVFIPRKWNVRDVTAKAN